MYTKKERRKEKVGILCRWGPSREQKRSKGVSGVAAAASILFRPSKILGGSVCRVAWPIVCKGSRSSSKELAEEEEEGSEAN